MHEQNRKKVIQAAERLERELKRFSDIMRAVHIDENIWLLDHIAAMMNGANSLRIRIHTLINEPHEYFSYWEEGPIRGAQYEKMMSGDRHGRDLDEEK